VNRANHPFEFFSASYLTRIDNQRAQSLRELRDGLEHCSDASMFHHTFQSLGRHHFLTEGFSNDVAQWVLASLNRPRLAEQLGGLDVRGYVDLTSLREDIVRIVDEFLRANPADADVEAFEPFYFCSSIELLVPLGWEAWTLREFRQWLERMGHGSFHFHFLVSRLRLHLQSNDFSVWFKEALGLDRLARLTERIDITTDTADGAKARLLKLVDRELAA
jgi:Family of unknown function (DUF5752)